jgi:beta-mannosidase
MANGHDRECRRGVAVLILSLVICSCSPFAYGQAATRSNRPLRDGWHVRQLESDRPDIAALTAQVAKPDKTWMPATMPAQIHDILLTAGKIPDPRVGRNAAKSAWVGEKDWAYACTFASPDGTGPVFLRFGGLDTIVAAYVNEQLVGRFKNMNRRHAALVRKVLKPEGQSNTLILVFSSPLRHGKEARKKGLSPNKALRKCHSDFGSYMGARPHSMKVGVFRDVMLDVPDRAWFDDICVRPILTKDLSAAKVKVLLETSGEKADIKWTLMNPSGKSAASGTAAPDAAQFELTIDTPTLWWPRTHGTPALYKIKVDLSVDGKVRDSRTVSFGLRRIRPILTDPKSGDKRFAFEINGKMIFLRGACWAPLEGMTHCWSQKRAKRLLDLVEHGRMNVMRIWGEGNIPPQEFYDECDRRGILLWHDFMFGYGMHPDGPESFIANCRAEIEDTIRRVRNHACLLMWCGGNENHMGWNFRHGSNPSGGAKLFKEIMPKACADLDPGRLFHPSSPHSGRVPNWPLEGDWHDYSTLKFTPMSSVPLYASEIGRVSAPSVSSMRRFMSPEELWPEGYDARIVRGGKPAWPPMWGYRSVGGSWDKIGRIERFCDPVSAEGLVRVLGTAHGEYLQQRIERQRRGVPNGAPDGTRRCWGNTIWRLNDSWPIIYWSAIDYYLEPKIPYYFLRRSYSPVLVCFERTDDRIAVWIVNDSPKAVSGKLILQSMRFDGKIRGKLTAEVTVKPGESRRCLDATDLGPINLRGEFLKAEFGGQSVTYLLMGERYLHLPKPGLSAEQIGGKIKVSTKAFARQVTLEAQGVTGAVFEDNFFDMAPGQNRSIRIINSAGARELQVRAVGAKPITVTLTGT